MPAPEPRISARRAYAEALGVYLAFFGASIVIAAGTLASFDVTNPEGWWITGSNGFDEIAQAALAVTVVILLAGRRGRAPAQIGLVGRRSRGGPGLRQGIRMAAWAAGAFFVGGIVTTALATGHFPFGHTDAANTLLDLSAAVNAGIVEETVVLGFVVTTLEQAGRPRAEIAVVALICRGAYHIYYGPGALGILVWAAVFLWLFWRFRSVVPMIVTHVCWDSLVFLGQVSSLFSVLLVLVILVLVVTAAVLWLVDRSDRPGPGPQWGDRTMWPPPTWLAPGQYGVAPVPYGVAPGSHGPPSRPSGVAPGSYGPPSRPNGVAPGSHGAPPVPSRPPAPSSGADGWGPPAGAR